MDMPLEHRGFADDYMDASGAPLAGHLGDSYAGIVSWLTDQDLPNAPAYRAWLLRQIAEGVPLAMMGAWGFYPDAAFLEALGLDVSVQPAIPPVKITHRDALVDYV